MCISHFQDSYSVQATFASRQFDRCVPAAKVTRRLEQDERDFREIHGREICGVATVTIADVIERDIRSLFRNQGFIESWLSPTSRRFPSQGILLSEWLLYFHLLLLRSTFEITLCPRR
jgi:hypothetical protein